MGRKLKYLGSADRRVLPKGTDWGGRLADPIGNEVAFDHDNHFIVDSDEAGLSDEAVELLLEDDDFRDVSDLKTIPLSLSEQAVRGRTRVDADEVEEMDTARGSSTKKGSSGGSTRGGGTTTTGGSTAGATGTTTGGSTGGDGA